MDWLACWRRQDYEHIRNRPNRTRRRRTERGQRRQTERRDEFVENWDSLINRKKDTRSSKTRSRPNSQHRKSSADTNKQWRCQEKIYKLTDCLCAQFVPDFLSRVMVESKPARHERKLWYGQLR